MVIYEMIYGRNPFEDSSEHETDEMIIDRIVNSNIHVDISSNNWNDLINKLLKTDRKQRLGQNGAVDILNHRNFEAFQSGNIH